MQLPDASLGVNFNLRYPAPFNPRSTQRADQPLGGGLEHFIFSSNTQPHIHILLKRLGKGRAWHGCHTCFFDQQLIQLRDGRASQADVETLLDDDDALEEWIESRAVARKSFLGRLRKWF